MDSNDVKASTVASYVDVIEVKQVPI